MKSFTRIGLPILVVVAAVFGITFVRMYSTDEPKPTDEPKAAGPGKGGTSREPLRIGLRTAAAVQGPPQPYQLPLLYWDAQFESGRPGHFEFWSQNPNPEPVTVRVPAVNCQCAGAELAVVPQDAFREYAGLSALAGGPLCPAPGPVAALAHVALDRRLTWAWMEHEGEKSDQVVPAADPAAGTQVAIVRLGWKAKGDVGPKHVSAEVMAGIGDAPATRYTLQADTMVVAAFDAARREGPSAFATAATLPVGDLRENGEVKREVYLFSHTRRQLVYSVSADHPDPCVTWTDPVPADEDEVRALTDFLTRDGKSARPKSVYKMVVAVRERVEVEAGGKRQLHQLDLGVVERRLTVSAVDGGAVHPVVKGRVLGDVTFLAGAPDGRVDLGKSFPADQDRTQDVVLLAERAGLDLTLAAGETTPNYLKVKLDKLEPLDGRNQWRLRVTVPKGFLFGALPETSGVVLTTTGPNPRRLRIPVRGMTYDSGGPRI
jgi:hypothetical protein